MFKALKKDTSNPKIDRFPCSKCGGLLTFKPGTQLLICQYCGQENEIGQRYDAIQEYDFHQVLIELAHAKPTTEIAQIQCDACGAGFKFTGSVHAGECPFCGTVIVTSTAQTRPITPNPYCLSKSTNKKPNSNSAVG